MKYRILVELQVVGPLDRLDEVSDLLADALYDLHGADDTDLGTNLTTGCLHVTMIVEASDLEEAVARSLAATRSAVHAVGGATPGWDRSIREVGTQARELADV
ncbi:conserved hypothetical protein [Frankia canadensis]|uniref:Uncharacterized protein n=1 Tax=Frankia canadensis TaxID=1836972 RepID=A0A2I2KLV9_9ACTN|nr:hypothetical protein [Frankia canadensis]SNQ46651.1 conserved hypothetical protein [Frankia canadensis]SOU53941.1 conserved hypothetical protein [Frankia canadensis]